MGGKSSDNSAMINEQKAQAQEARDKEAARQARIDQGLTGIRNAFEGAPVMGTRSGSYDWSTFAPTAGTSGSATGGSASLVNALTGLQVPSGQSSGSQVSGLPAGYSYVQVDDTPAATSTAAKTTTQQQQQKVGGRDAATTNSGGNVGGSSGGFGTSGSAGQGSHWMDQSGSGAAAPNGSASGGKKWAIKGPDGKIYNQGDNIETSSSYDTGQKTGGFDDSFFNEYKQGILDYYSPQVADQYGDAKDDLTYKLARAGTLQSSMATEQQADLAKQNTLNQADVQSKADSGAAELRTRIASEKAKAESQLYATENPDVATNQALAAVKNISLAEPELSPLGEIFKVAAVGGANAVTGYRNQSLINQIPGTYRKKDTSVVS